MVILYSSITMHTTPIMFEEIYRFPQVSKLSLKIIDMYDLEQLNQILLNNRIVYGLDLEVCSATDDTLDLNYSSPSKSMVNVYETCLLEVLTNNIKTLQHITLRIHSKYSYILSSTIGVDVQLPTFLSALNEKYCKSVEIHFSTRSHGSQAIRLVHSCYNLSQRGT